MLRFLPVLYINFQLLENKRDCRTSVTDVRLPDVFEPQGLSLNLLSKLVMYVILLQKRFVLFEYFQPSLKILELM